MTEFYFDANNCLQCLHSSGDYLLSNKGFFGVHVIRYTLIKMNVNIADSCKHQMKFCQFEDNI